MKLGRILIALIGLLVATAALTACGGDDAPSDEEYFRNMDELDKETDTLFETVCAEENISGKQCGTEFADAMSTTETKLKDVKPASDAKEEHEELVVALEELRGNTENAAAELTEDDPVDAFFETGAFDTTRVDTAFCAIQAIADQKNIDADVGCDGGEEVVDPSTIDPVETTDVLIEGFAFDAPHIQVSVGDTVTWTQGTDGETHTATADDDTFDSGALTDEGETFEFTFDEPGEYPYHCEPHPEMLGLITVVE
jgi:plastocyanin